MKIGIIFCAFNCADTIEECLKPWREVKDENFLYSCISAPFKQYENSGIPEDNTIKLVSESKLINKHFYDIGYPTEIEARGLCLDFLKKNGCDVIWQVDGDEVYTVEEINNILKYVEEYPQIAWFRLSLKNFVFDQNTYLADPFTPARIFRLSYPPFKAGSFRDDNNLSYIYGEGQDVWDECLANKIIPKEIAWITHYSWLSNETSKNKVKYQKDRGWNCSYEWDEVNNKLIFNPQFYRGRELPKTIKLNE